MRVPVVVAEKFVHFHAIYAQEYANLSVKSQKNIVKPFLSLCGCSIMPQYSTDGFRH
jgi:hypothetical protein